MLVLITKGKIRSTKSVECIDAPENCFKQPDL